MAWTSSAKTLGITAKLPYVSSHPNVVGRTPVSTAIAFTWFEFMLAAAKASHLSYVAPSAAAPEFELMLRLVGPHVDDVSTAFAILSSASGFKDYVGAFFTGTVAAGLAVRAMVDEGYVWFAHFEALGSTAPSRKTPDYAMLGPGTGIALMEAKGSAAQQQATFVAAVRKGYREQVRPHLGHQVGGITATHGYSVGSWMRFGMSAEMRIAHTAPSTTGNTHSSSASGGAVDPVARTALLRSNYAGAFTLAHSPELGVAMRAGGAPLRPPQFARFEWRGRRWLSALTTAEWLPHPWMGDDILYMMVRHGVLRLRDLRGAVFAVENDIGKAALTAFLLNPDGEAGEVADISPLEFDGRKTADERFVGEGGGAFLPDGLALIELPRDGRQFELIEWNGPRRQFERVASIKI